MNLGRALRVLFALALLSAQQAALSHQIWHASGRDNSQPAQQLLCDQHDALGTVAGALDCPILQRSDEAPGDFLLGSIALPGLAIAGLTPSSRGPPTLL
jgi:hypothetical protein